MGPVSKRIIGNDSIKGALSRDFFKDKEKKWTKINKQLMKFNEILLIELYKIWILITKYWYNWSELYKLIW